MPKSSACLIEARCSPPVAVFFTQDKLDARGYPVRDQDSSSYVATFEPASVFAGLIEAGGA